MARDIQGHGFLPDPAEVQVGSQDAGSIEDWLDHIGAIRTDDGASAAKNPMTWILSSRARGWG